MEMGGQCGECRKAQQVLILKMVLDNGLLNVLTVYAPHSGKLEEEKRVSETNTLGKLYTSE